MYIAKVIGKVVSVIKHPAYDNRTLLLVQPLSLKSQLVRTPTIAVDYVGGRRERYRACWGGSGRCSRGL